jgi:hypothetical protein
MDAEEAADDHEDDHVEEEERGRSRRFRVIQRERSASPALLNRRYSNGSSSPRTARVRVHGGPPFIDGPEPQLDAGMSQMSSLLRKREALVKGPKALLGHARNTTTLHTLNQDIFKLYESECMETKPCMCRRLCHVVHCRATTNKLPSPSSKTMATLITTNTTRVGCITTRRNLLFLVQSSLIAHPCPSVSSSFETKMLNIWKAMKLNIEHIENNKSSISMYETAQIFAGMSQQSQARLHDLNEPELTAVQVLVGTRMGLKPRKSPLRVSGRGPSPTPQTTGKTPGKGL